MIDFRYHLVSIIAVFLALAIGIFVGATALQGPVGDILNRTANQVTKENEALIQQNNALSQRVAEGDVFAQAAASRLLDGLLDQRRVVLVTAPGADGQAVSGITAAVRQAGGTVTGQVAISQVFFDTSASTENSLSSLAARFPAAGPGVIDPAASASSGTPLRGQQAAAVVLAGALVTRTAPGAASPSSPGGSVSPAASPSAGASASASAGASASASRAQDNAILADFSQQGYLQVTGGTADSIPPATLAVVVGPAAPVSGNDASPGNQILIDLALALRKAGDAALLAGSLSGSGPGSAIDALTSGAIGGPLTTVDDADTTTGQIIVVQALAGLLAGHKAAAYGVGPGAAPSPAPTPAASASPVPGISAAGRHTTARRSSARRHTSAKRLAAG